MTEFTDRAAGVAAFRVAGSLCIRLHGRIDPVTARLVEERLREERVAVRLRLECSSVEAVDPDAARILAGSVLAWARRGSDRSVDVLNLRLDVEREPGSRPLRIFRDPDELLFYDPDGDDPADVAPSRH